MGDEATRYDPYIPAESATKSAGAGSSRTAQIQAQIDETVGVMRDNINRVNERGENLDALQDLSLIHISEPTRHFKRSRMPSSA